MASEHTLLQQLIDQRAGQTITAAVGAAVEKVAEEIARETLADETFRRMLRELVQRRSAAILNALLADGGEGQR